MTGIAARSLDDLVDRQFRLWEESRRSHAAERPRPCVALSRLPGAGAAALGQGLADHLGYAFFGIELVDRIAREAGRRKELVAGVDEHVRSAIDRFVTDAFQRERFTESDYVRHLVRTLASLAERGGAIVLGRGSPFVLPAERALRVLAVAPRELRAERIAKQEDLSPRAALRRVDALDAERRSFLTHHFGRDPDDPAHYDLCVNLGTLGQAGAERLVVDALRERFPG